MKLRIEHTTTFKYDQPISEAYTEMRLRPLDGNGQHTLIFSLHTEPHDEPLMYQDRFGNDVRHFDVIQPHQKLVVSARSDVLTSQFFSSEESHLSPLDQFDFLMPTPYVTFTDEIAEFAAGIGPSYNAYETTQAIMNAIYAYLQYEKGATTVTTSAAEALQIGRGVCQDFSHLMLAACRSRQLPARYVSGYLYNNGYSTATHAWVDVFIPERGWVSFDPTHNREQSEHYVRVAVGRDYADVSPTRGVFVGNTKEAMEVQVTVEEF